MATEKEPTSVAETPREFSCSPTILEGVEDLEKKIEGRPTVRRDSSASTINATDSDTEAQANRRSESNKTPLPIKVPRSQRRGFLGRFCLLAEVENPRHYSNRTKWMLTAVVAVAAIAAPVGSAILLPSLGEISVDFNSPPTVVNLSIALYFLSLSIFPLWWSMFSEKFGRRTVYIVSFGLFILWNVLTGVSTNIAMLIVMRILAGGASGSVQAVGAGTVADIWEPKERGAAMGMFYLGPLMGPLLAPIIGGALQEKWKWRATAWFMVIYGGVALLLLILVLPETLAKKSNPLVESGSQGQPNDSSDGGALSRTTTRQTINKNTKAAAKAIHFALIEPLAVVKYLRFPAVAISVYYASITFASLYVLQISIQSTFAAAPYDFPPILIGCTYLFNSVGYLVASIFGGRWNDYIMAREARKAKRYDEKGELVVRPEDRMRENGWLAAFMYPSALLWYGWAAQYHAPWAAVLVANFFFGLGSMIVFGLVTTMLTEFMPRKSSSGVALNNFCRNICSCIGIFVCQPLLDAIGNGWLFTALFIITLLSSSVIYFMKRCGSTWRVKMDEALKDEK